MGFYYKHNKILIEVLRQDLVKVNTHYTYWYHSVERQWAIRKTKLSTVIYWIKGIVWKSYNKSIKELTCPKTTSKQKNRTYPAPFRSTGFNKPQSEYSPYTQCYF